MNARRGEEAMTRSDNKQGVGSTTGAGAPAPSDRNSLTIGPDGPILLHDVHFLEQMAHFNREKVPERQPHAKGAGAFGIFETTADVSARSDERRVGKEWVSTCNSRGCRT